MPVFHIKSVPVSLGSEPGLAAVPVREAELALAPAPDPNLLRTILPLAGLPHQMAYPARLLSFTHIDSHVTAPFLRLPRPHIDRNGLRGSLSHHQYLSPTKLTRRIPLRNFDKYPVCKSRVERDEGKRHVSTKSRNFELWVHFVL